MRVATIKVHEKPVEERRERKNREEGRERSRKTILLRDAAMSCISEKNYGPRERSQIVEIIRGDSSPVLLLAPPAISSLAGRFQEASCPGNYARGRAKFR